jgi:hypothetical protein
VRAIGSELNLSRFVFRIFNQAYTGKKENSAQNRINNDHTDTLTPRPSVCEPNGCKNEADYPHQGQDDAQYAFFHRNVFIGYANEVPLKLGQLKFSQISLFINEKTAIK